jgi:hypothetical protein
VQVSLLAAERMNWCESFWAAVKEVCGKSLIFAETIVKAAQLGSQFGRNKLYARFFPFRSISFVLGLNPIDGLLAKLHIELYSINEKAKPL